MPIYEYQCNKCSTVFEEWLKTSECDLAQTCPNCQEKAQRIVSQTSFVLKGSGWYVTEYGKDSASSSPKDMKNTNKEQSSDTKKEDSSTESSAKEVTETKPDTQETKVEDKVKAPKESKKASARPKKAEQ